MRQKSALISFVCAAAALWVNAPAAGAAQDIRQQIDEAISKAASFLMQRQHDDGTWRSETYGSLRDDLALTATIAKALSWLPPAFEAQPAAAKATGVLREWITANSKKKHSAVARSPQNNTTSGGVAELRLEFPVYTAAMAAMVLHRSQDPDDLAARDKWLALLRSHQLTENLGWSTDDLSFGGWGYSVRPPRKNFGGGECPPFQSDLSSTLFALAALGLCGVPDDDPVLAKAGLFVLRCQNYCDDEPSRQMKFDDGGFILAPACPIQNKAGAAGTDAAGRQRFHSYGTATADGLRAMLALGFNPDHPRVIPARHWLESHFSTTHVPGTFEPMLQRDRNAPFYYYCWSVAHAFHRLGVQTIQRGDEEIDWPRELALELLRRQNNDGRWINPLTFMKEDDPLVATPLALAALTICREMLPPESENQITTEHTESAE